MIRYYCDLCGCDARLSLKIVFHAAVSYEVCRDCHNSVHEFFKDIYMNMKEEKK